MQSFFKKVKSNLSKGIDTVKDVVTKPSNDKTKSA